MEFKSIYLYTTLKSRANRRILTASVFTGPILFILFIYNIERANDSLSIEVSPTINSMPNHLINITHQQQQQNLFTSFCSSEADRRGPHQNVIAISLYGNFSDPHHFTRYVDPSLKFILSNISQIYPGTSTLL